MKTAIILILFAFASSLASPSRDLRRVALDGQRDAGGRVRAIEILDLGQEFDLTIGETKGIKGAELKVSFTSVAEDSRCPQGMGCVWQGNAKVILKLEQGKRRAASISLNTTLKPKQELFRGYDIRLVKLNPEMNKSGKIEQGDYVATLVVTRR